MDDIDINSLLVNESDKENNDYFCPICGGFLNPDESIQTSCLHIFCKPCVIQIRQNSLSSCRCPICRSITSESGQKPLKDCNLFAYNALSLVQIRCKNSECDKTFPLNELEGHLKECEYEMIDCPYCDEKEIKRINLMKHMSDNMDTHFIKQFDLIMKLQDEIKRIKRSNSFFD